MPPLLPVPAVAPDQRYAAPVLVPRSVPALAFLAARLADERYAQAWQFRQYGYWIGRIDAVRDMARADAMDELFAIVEYLGGSNEFRATS